MSAQHNHNQSNNAEKKRVALVSVFASGGLSIAKFVAALLTGSLGMLSEAVHSLVDMVATIVTWFAINWGDKPADDDHHYGHEKVESVAALFEAVLLFGTALFIAYHAIMRLMTRATDVDVTWWATGILIISIIVDFNRSRVLKSTAEATSSAALAADAKHFTADMYSSFAALVGLAGVWFGWPWTDAVAALIVSCFIAFIGWALGKETFSALLDTAPQGVTTEIRHLVEDQTAILHIDQLRVRHVGQTLHVAIVAAVPRVMAITDIAALQGNLKAKILSAHPRADVTVSIHAVELDDETAAQKVTLIAAQSNLAIHHLTVQRIADNLAVSFDLEVDGATSLKIAHDKATELEGKIRDALGTEVEVESHIEPQPLQLVDGKTASVKVATVIEKSLRLAARKEKLLSDIHNVRVRKTSGGLFVHYHCRFAPSQAITVVHSVVDRIENVLQAKHSDIRRVVAHAEPVGQAHHKL
jgi:cation diffusion facilitator family transporter